MLAEARVVDDLTEAFQDCHLVFGTSTRIRELNWVSLTARAAAEKIAIKPIQNVAYSIWARTMWSYERGITTMPFSN